jgi:hypothetical protein
MTWLIWALFCFGLVFLVTAASITAWPRRFLFNLLGPRWGGWLACAPCTAFWVGVAVGLPDVAVFALWAPELALASPTAVLLTSHLGGGIIFMGLTAAVQYHWNLKIAELGQPEPKGNPVVDQIQGTVEKWAAMMEKISHDPSGEKASIPPTLVVCLAFEDRSGWRVVSLEKFLEASGDTKGDAIENWVTTAETLLGEDPMAFLNLPTAPQVYEDREGEIVKFLIIDSTVALVADSECDPNEGLGHA